MRLRRVALMLALLPSLLHCAALAQTPSPAALPQPGPPGLRTVSTAQYREHLDDLRRLVADCGREVTTCDPVRVGALDDYVQRANGQPFIERYNWLRNLLADRNDTSHALRNQMLPYAEQRLAEQEAELDAPPADVPLTQAQRSSRSAVLAGKEFRTTSDYSLTEKISAWISDALARLFGGASSLGRMAPWLGQALQWGSLLLAAVLMLLWVYRTLDRQRIALGKLSGDADRRAQQAESRAWAERARAHAERGEWRDAVHCLYWASIVALEDRRTLRPSTNRTPREALRLIDPASHLRAPLRAQTGEFERIWYGLQPAAETDYNHALTQYQALQTSRGTHA